MTEFGFQKRNIVGMVCYVAVKAEFMTQPLGWSMGGEQGRWKVEVRG
jgi:hypothetical protein